MASCGKPIAGAPASAWCRSSIDDGKKPAATRRSRLGVAGIRMEQLLAVDLVAGDGALAGRRDQPIDELLAQLRLDVRVLLGIDQHDAVLVEQPLVALDDNDQVTFVLE